MEEILGIPMETIQNNILVWAKHVVFALLIFWIGMRVVKLMMRALNKALQLRQVDPSLTTFLQSLVKI
ncbi:MAG: mechanosensitive ion channel family protein, partial [Schleiferiaceae bacterium]